MSRVEIKNAGINHREIKARHVIVTQEGSFTVPDDGDNLHAQPGQRVTLNAGERRAILIEEVAEDATAGA